MTSRLIRPSFQRGDALHRDFFRARAFSYKLSEYSRSQAAVYAYRSLLIRSLLS